jgi:hypothetical protein
MVQGMIQQETAIRTMLGRIYPPFVSLIGPITATAQHARTNQGHGSLQRRNLGLDKVLATTAFASATFQPIADESFHAGFKAALARLGVCAKEG